MLSQRYASVVEGDSTTTSAVGRQRVGVDPQ